MNYESFHQIVEESEHPVEIEAKCVFRQEHGFKDRDFIHRQNEIDEFIDGYYQYLASIQEDLRNKDIAEYEKGFQDGYWSEWFPRRKDPTKATTPYELGYANGYNEMVFERS